MVSHSKSKLSEKEVFFCALDYETEKERNDYLNEECGSDLTLLARVRALLSAHEENAELLDEEESNCLTEERISLAKNLQEESSFTEGLGKTVLRLGDYEILEEIGRGAMGVVYRARQLGLNREVALKVILGASFVSPESRERFRMEAEAAANLQDRHMVPLYEIGEHDGHDYYSMAYIKGGTLRDHLEDFKKDLRRSVKTLATLARTIQIAHDRGILHRDLKPDNILIDEQGEPLISDFGLAYNLDVNQSLTLTGQILGSPQYMAPEQADGDSLKITTQADVYSLGAILYELLAGVPAFESASVFQTLQMVKETIPRPLGTHNAKIDRDLEVIVAKCLEKDPKQRYSSAKRLAEDLEAWLEYRPIAARPPSTFERLSKWVRRRPIHAALAVTAALFVLTLGIGGPITALRQATLRHEAEVSFALAEERAEQNQQQLYYSNMNLSGLALTESGMFPSLNELLDRWVPEPEGKDRRGWEWYFLSSFMNQTSFTVPGDKKEINALGISPNNRLFVTAAWDRSSINFHDLNTGELVKKIPTREGNYQALWNPAGTRLLSSCRPEMVLHDLQSGQIVAKVKLPHPPKNEPAYCAWHPDGSLIASAGGDKMIRIWDGSSLKLIKEFPILNSSDKSKKFIEHIGVISKLSWSPNGKHLAIMVNPRDDSRFVYVKSLNDPDKPVLRLSGHTRAIRDIAWSPDSTLLATGGSDKTIRISKIPSGEIHHILRGHTGWVTAMAWHPDGKQLVSGSINREIKIWDIAQESVLENLAGQTDGISHLAWSHDGQAILSGHPNGGIKAWKTGDSRASHTLFQYNQGIDSLAWAPDSSSIACTTIDHNTFVIDLATGKKIHSEKIQKRKSYSTVPLTWSPDGRHLTNHTNAHFVSLVDPQTGKTSHHFYEKLSKVMSSLVSAAWSPDSRHLVTCSFSAQINLFDSEKGTLIRQISKELDEKTNVGGLLDISWSPDGKYLVTSGLRERLVVWDASNDEILHHHIDQSSPQTFRGHSWSPTGKRFALGGFNSEITIWEPNPLIKIATLTGHTSEAATVSWHPTEERLASGSGDQTIKIWDLKTGVTTITLRGHTNDVTGVAWSPDGRVLASTSLDGTLRLWDASKAYTIESTRTP